MKQSHFIWKTWAYHVSILLSFPSRSCHYVFLLLGLLPVTTSVITLGWLQRGLLLQLLLYLTTQGRLLHYRGYIITIVLYYI